MIKILFQHAFYFLTLIVVVSCSTCVHPTMFSAAGTLVGGYRYYSCSEEVYKIDFGTTQNMQLKWNSFNVLGEMPLCIDGNLKIKIGYVYNYHCLILNN